MATFTAASDIQNAVYDLLSGNAPFMALIPGGILDNEDVTTIKTFPYITLGEITESLFDTFTRNGFQVEQRIHIWSKYNGKKEALTILAAMNALLHYANITVPNHGLVYFRYNRGVYVPEFGIRHYVAIYDSIVQSST